MRSWITMSWRVHKTLSLICLWICVLSPVAVVVYLKLYCVAIFRSVYRIIGCLDVSRWFDPQKPIDEQVIFYFILFLAGGLSWFLFRMFQRLSSWIRSTPRLRNGKNVLPYPSMDWLSPCDAPFVFISYKSQNVDIARQIADQLIAQGIHVWFNEYMILLKNRDEFEEAIHQGLACCTHAIILTSDAYHKSDWCKLELDGLRAQLAPNRVLHVRLEQYETDTERALREWGVYTHSLEENDVNALWDSLSRILALRLIPQGFPVEAALRAALIYDELKLSIDVAGWTIRQLNQPPQNNLDRDVRLLKMSKYIEGQEVTLFIDVGSQNYVHRCIEISPKQEDRDFYYDMQGLFKKYLDEYAVGGFRCHGCHLMHALGHANIAVSLFQGEWWMRQYSIVLDRRDTPTVKKDIELCIQAGVKTCFANYCMVVPHLDAVVKSLKIT